MTTTIKVTSHNYPALVETFERGWDAEQNRPADLRKRDSRVLTPADGEQSFYCTTSMELRVVDLEYDDPRVPAPPAVVEAAPAAEEPVAAAPAAPIDPAAPLQAEQTEAAPAAPEAIVEPVHVDPPVAPAPAAPVAAAPADPALAEAAPAAAPKAEGAV
jgi:hypothetical protein